MTKSSTKETADSVVSALRARHVLNADEYIHPAMSREEARRQAFMRLKAAVDTFPHPCGTEETKR